MDPMFMISITRDFIVQKAVIEFCHIGELDCVARVVCKNDEATIKNNVSTLAQKLRVTRALKITY